MKPLEKITLIDDIGRELQNRFKFTEIYSYLGQYGIDTNYIPSYNSKYVYTKEVLTNVEDDIIIRIAEELGIPVNFKTDIPIFKDSSTSFWKIGFFKLFISHLASFKSQVSILKSELEKYGITSFVAHEDIEPTKEWQDEIEKGLHSMDALCAILMPGFKESNWTDQEIGFAIGKGVCIIPIRKGMDPYGFIGKYQGFQSNGKSIKEVAEAIFQILSKNQKTRDNLIKTLIDLFLVSSNLSDANLRLIAIQKIENIQIDKINYLYLRVPENHILNDTHLLASLNLIFISNGINQISKSDFVENKIKTYNELPF